MMIIESIRENTFKRNDANIILLGHTQIQNDLVCERSHFEKI